MAEITLNINDEVVNIIEDKGYSVNQFFKNICDYILAIKALPAPFDSEDDSDFELNEETKAAIRQGRADFYAGKLKGYSSLEEMIKDIDNWNE